VQLVGNVEAHDSGSHNGNVDGSNRNVDGSNRNVDGSNRHRSLAIIPRVLNVIGGRGEAMQAILLGALLGLATPTANLNLGKLGMGTWSWGNKVIWGYDPAQDGELAAAFDRAVAGGVRFWDTGDSYGTFALEGRAESLLGEFRRELGATRPRLTRDLCFGTKLAVYPWRLTSDSFVAAARASAARMGLEQIEVVQAHWSAQRFQPWQERALWEGLADCYNLGLCKAVGLSNFGPKQLAACAEYMQGRGVPVVLNQVQLSLLCTQPLESGLIDVCKQLKVTPIAYSPLALGALSGKYTVDRLPPGARGLVVGQVLSGAKPLTGTIADIARTRRKTPAQVALNWAMRKGAVPIVGVRTVAQVEENLGACSFALSGAEVAELDAAARLVMRGATQNVFMTD
jgi:pyridoxine 4-dehydrogenase